MSKKFNENHPYTIDEISEAMGVSWSSYQRILTVDLNMRHVAAKFVPRMLTQFQRCFTQWEKRLDKCIASNGEYFEGD
jgi:hypothetical protein